MAAQRHKILVVDDDSDIRDTLELLLGREGFAVETAVDGAEALEALGRDRPDLVILDVMMTTDTEGYDLAARLRESEEYRDLPIILLTSFLGRAGEMGPEAFQHVLEAPWPAMWLFEKPVDAKKLLKKIKGLLAPR